MGRRSKKGQRPSVPHGRRDQRHTQPDQGEDTVRDGGATEHERPWAPWLAVALLVAAVFAAYANSLHGPFFFDDGPSIVGNPSIRQLASLRIFAAPPDAVTTTGRPILNATLAINYAIGGLSVEGYHVANVLIHLLAALTLFGLVRRTLRLPSLAARFASASTGLALAVSLLWALHPLQTESVTYVVQRAESLVGLFYLLTLYGYLRGATSPRPGRWFAAAVIACALGMGSKEVMVSAPLMVILFDRLFLTSAFVDGFRQRGRMWLAMAATWAVLIVAFLGSAGRGGSAGFGLGMTAWSYARTQFGWILHYLRLSLWPHPLVIDYGNSVLGPHATVAPAALGVFLLLAATVAGLFRRPMLGFLGVWFFAILAPSSSIVPLAGQTAAEHRMYLPLAAVVMLAVLAIHRLAQRLGPHFRRAGVVMLAIAAVALGARTHQRNQDYQSELAIWDDAVRNGPPNSRSYLNRGNALLENGQNAAAIQDFDHAIRLYPGYAKPYNARGNALLGEGRYDEALRDYDKAIRLKPDFAEAHNGRGTAHGNLGHVDEAIAAFTRAIELNPQHEEAHYNRGCALNAKGQPDAAIADFTRAVQLRPDYVDAYANRGNSHQALGRYQAAIADYDHALSLRPDDLTALQGRAVSHFQTRAYDRTWADVAALRKHGATVDPGFIDELTKASGRSN